MAPSRIIFQRQPSSTEAAQPPQETVSPNSCEIPVTTAAPTSSPVDEPQVNTSEVQAQAPTRVHVRNAAASTPTTRRTAPPITTFARIPCRYFGMGFCSRGNTCWYKHEQPASRPPSPPPTGPEEKETCAICFEIPEQYGLMTGCDHVFCLSCIREWRKSSNSLPTSDDPNLGRASKTCPLCRICTRFVIPSPIVPTRDSEKLEIGNRYLNRLSKIPCRHFVASLAPQPQRPPGSHPRPRMSPMCPFGNECHYKHEIAGVKHRFSDRDLARMRRTRERDRRTRNFGFETGYVPTGAELLDGLPSFVLAFLPPLEPLGVGHMSDDDDDEYDDGLGRVDVDEASDWEDLDDEFYSLSDLLEFA